MDKEKNKLKLIKKSELYKSQPNPEGFGNPKNE